MNSNESRASSVTWCIIYEETPNSIDYTDVKARSRERYIKRLRRAKCAGTREDFVPFTETLINEFGFFSAVYRFSNG